MNRPFIHIVIILFLIALIFCFSGCQPASRVRPKQKNGKLYGVTEGLFRSRWWNFYERGVSFLDGGFWQEAEADFRQALMQKDMDRKRERTYGRHLTDYFPHRELGVTLYYQKRYTEAIQELETSLSCKSCEKSARAEFYLDRARKSWIEQENLDTSIPGISVKSPDQDALFNQFTVAVSGVAEDDTFVKEILVNNRPVRIDVAAPQISFYEKVSLRRGENSIIIKARDLTGKTAETVRRIICDRSGPALNIDGLAPSPSDNSYIIRGYAHDESGIRKLLVNGQNILKNPVQEIVLNYPIVLPSGREKAVIIAEDQAGNQTQAEIFPSYAESNDQIYYAQTEKGIMSDRKKENMYKESGNYYALIIGIDKYMEWPSLNNAVRDASGLRQILISQYGFSAENITLRTDNEATWDTLINDLNHLAGRLEETDNLLIYYSGHGQLDPINNDGYWIPVDGKLKDATTWITNSAIRNTICSQNVRGKNIIVIADSCYSGTLLRSVPNTSPVYERHVQKRISKQSLSSNGKDTDTVFRGKTVSGYNTDYQDNLLALARKKSREIISSGGIEAVIDSDKKKSGHSPFAYHLLKALKENSAKVICFEDLLHEIATPIAKKTWQRPKYGHFITNMDDDGLFVLVLKTESAGRIQYKNKGNTSAVSKKPHSLFSDRESRLPDPVPPVIQLKRWAEKQTVFIDQAFLELNVYDDSGIQKVMLNNQDILTRPGRNLYLNSLVNLSEGDNTFVIECVDQVGNRIKQKVEIHRKIQKVYEIGSRMPVVLFPFIVKGMQGMELANLPIGNFIDSNFLTHLIDSRRFNMKEPLAMNQPSNQEDALELAKKLGADFVLNGEILAKEYSLQISVRMIEAGTSHLLTYEDVYGENIDSRLVAKLCQGLVVKLRDSLPLVEGQIAKIKDKEVLISLGGIHQIREGMHVIFFEEGEPVRINGEILGADVEELGAARIRKLLPKMSHTELFDIDDLSGLRTGLGVVTK